MSSPLTHVYQRIDQEPTGLESAGRVYRDGTLRLDWSGTPWWRETLPAVR